MGAGISSVLLPRRARVRYRRAAAPTFDASQHRVLSQLDVNVAMTRLFSDIS